MHGRGRSISRDLLGLALIGFGLFLFLSLGSFTSRDPSFNAIRSLKEVKNLGGLVGSFTSDLLLQLFGFAAWVIPTALLFLGISLFRSVEISESKWKTGIFVTLTMALSCWLEIFSKASQTLGYSPGGVAGRVVVALLSSWINKSGVVLLLITVSLGLLVVLSAIKLDEWLNGIFKVIKLGGRKSLAIFSFFELVARYFEKQLAGKQTSGMGVAMTSSPSGDYRVLDSKRRFEFNKYNLSTRTEAQNVSVLERFGDLGNQDVRKDVVIEKTQIKPSARATKPVVLVENWKMPNLDLLRNPPLSILKLDEREIKLKAKLLSEKLAQFSVRGEVVGIKPGPAVTLFEFKPAADVKISKITDLADDLSLALSSESVRIIAPIPGRDVVGIETSNSHRETVYLKDIVEIPEFWDEESKLPIGLGRQADGAPKVVDLRRMPHLLVAGTTGSGKSVFVVSLITGLLLRHSPKSLRLILVDPKQVDLAAFDGLPHLISPTVRDPKKAVNLLKWAIREMEKRYRSMSLFGARGIEGFNEIATGFSAAEIQQHEEFHQTLAEGDFGKDYYFRPQPYIVIVVEEFGDLMAVDKANVEQAVVRLAQMARACGIHLVLAMQSPRKDVVTGLIKTNIPGRISFKVSSKMDSRIILDESGAERLLARGDMLFLAPGVSKPLRNHGAFLSEDEIQGVVGWWKAQGVPDYSPLALRALEGSNGASAEDELEGISDDEVLEKDDRYDEIVAYVGAQREISASLLQRRFRLGYPRAARMIEHFEARGVVGPANGAKPRQVLIRDMKML